MRVLNDSIKQLFERLEEVGIPLEEGSLTCLIREYQKRLAEYKQAINREVGFVVNLYSEDHWKRSLDEVGEGIVGSLTDSVRISSLLRRLQQINDLANGNHRVLGRRFGLYPKYRLDSDGKIITISEISIGDLPDEVMGMVSYQGQVFIKATYSGIAVQESGDPWFVGVTSADLVKMGIVNLAEDYRIGKLGCQIFALTDCSVYLFSPDMHVDLISSVAMECLGCVHPDFTLPVDIEIGKRLDRLILLEKQDKSQSVRSIVS